MHSVAIRFLLALAYYVLGRLDDTRLLLEGLASERVAGVPDYATMRWIAVITGDSPDRVTIEGLLGVLAARQERRGAAPAPGRTPPGTEAPHAHRWSTRRAGGGPARPG